MAKDSKLKIILLGEDQASDEINQVGSSLTKNLGGAIMKGAAVGLATVGAGMAAAGAAAYKLAADAAPLKGVQDAFAGIAEAASFSSAEMLASLKSSSAGMVTNRDLMMSFNKASQLVSVDFARTLPDAMGMLGKVAEATGEDVGFMLDSLVTGVGRLSPMILDNLGIQVDLTAAMEDYAEANGLVVSEMTKQEQQAALTAQVLDKLAENTDAMPDLADSASAKFASFGVAMEDFKDTVGLALLPVITPFMEFLSEMAAKYLPLITEKMQPFLETISSLASALFDAGPASSEFREALSLLLPEDVIDRIYGFIEGFNQFGEGVGSVIQGTVLPILQTLWGWISQFLPVAIQVLSDFWTGILQPAIQNTMGWIETYVMPLLNVLWEILQEVIPPAIQALSDFWTNVLYPAMKELFDWIWANVMPALGEIFLWIADNLPPAIQALADFWENTLKPALDTVWQFLVENVVPILETVFEWISENLPPALQTLADFWENTLLPAINAVWDFFNAYIVPILEVLVEIIGETLSLAIEALAGLWENVLLPALDKVWDFIETYVTPALTWLKDNVISPLASVIQDTLIAAFERLLEKIQIFRDWLANIKLPWWLTPGSPTPFELGIVGITDAMGDLMSVLNSSAAVQLNAVLSPTRTQIEAPPFGLNTYMPEWMRNIQIPYAEMIDKIIQETGQFSAPYFSLIEKFQKLGIIPKDAAVGTPEMWVERNEVNNNYNTRQNIIYASSPAAAAYLMQQARQEEFDDISAVI